MLREHEIALEWIRQDAEAISRGAIHTAPMPFNLEKFRVIRDSLARAGYVRRSPEGRWLPSS